MIVCSCNVFSENQVRAVLATFGDARTPSAVYRCLGCSPQCGRCARTIRAILDEVHGCGACEEECHAGALEGRVVAAE